MTKDSNLQKTWCVYIHTSKTTGKKYVGITHYEDPNIRWRNGANYKHNPHFSRAIDKYGWRDFDHEIVVSYLTKEQANVLERFYIDQFKKQGISYNIADGGEGHEGQPLSEETRKKISESLKAKKMIPWNKGKTGVYSEETLQKISESGKGRPGWNKGLKMGPLSEETRKKISEAHKGLNTWSKGKKYGNYSEEHRKKISEGLKGKRLGIPLGPRPDDVKNKISNSRKGLKWICKMWEQPKQINQSELEYYLSNGWNLGKTIKYDGQAYKWSKQQNQWIINNK